MLSAFNSRACGMFRRAPLALVNRTPARARRHARTKHVKTWTLTCTHATCAAVEACTLGRYLVLPTLSHTCTLSMASCSAVMVAGLQGVVLCVSAARDLRVQETAQWRVARVSSSDHPCRMHKYLVHIPDHSTARNSCRKQEAHERDGDGVAIHEH